MIDSLVKITSSRSVVGFNPTTLLPQRVTQWEFMVGTHGPFVRTTPDDHFNAQYIEEETNKVVKTLRDTGAL